MKKYEGLFILEVAGKEEAEKDIIDRVQKEIENAGGKVETVQKMGPKPYARTTAKHSVGNYVNVIFTAPAPAISALDAKFHLDTELFRWHLTEFIPEKPRKARTQQPEQETEITAFRR